MFSNKELINIRRKLHQHPEIGLKEKWTHNFLIKKIKNMDSQNISIKVIKEVPTAILIRIKGYNPKKTIAWRSDMDALPIHEETNLSFASLYNNAMHACGHDIHMTIALGILDYFSENQPQDNLLIFFQPAEENNFGGKRFFDAGGFGNEYYPDEFYALHINPQLLPGQIGFRSGTLCAGSNELRVSFIGKAGHAAYPQKANDALLSASNFVVSLQSVISRNLNPLEGGVVTIGKFESGKIMNIISGQTNLEGTIRSFTQNGMQIMTKHIQQIAEGIAKSFGQKLKINFRQGGYLPVVNNSELSHFFINFIKKNQQADFKLVKPSMIAEDFGFLTNKFKGLMFWLGVGDYKHTLHSANLNPNEQSICRGLRIIISFLKARMKK